MKKSEMERIGIGDFKRMIVLFMPMFKQNESNEPISVNRTKQDTSTSILNNWMC